MLHQRLTSIGQNLDAPAVVTPAAIVSWAKLQSQIVNYIDQFAQLQGQRVGLHLPASADGIALLAALDKLQAHVYLLDALASDEQSTAWAERFGLQAVSRFATDDWQVSYLAGTADPTAQDASLVTILTSGTEGTPKAATYTWAQLARPVRLHDLAGTDVWLLSFRIHLYAGLQVLLQALLNGQTLVIPDVSASPQDVVELMATHKVSCASATPSYWRRLVLFGDPARLATVPLRQITLGGELADQPLLSSLRQLFPQARIVHIYATTELGRCFAVTDGLAGFPKSYLDDETRDESRSRQVDARLKVVAGQLFVQPIHGMDRAETRDSHLTTDEWIPTGDLVEVTDDRVFFAGRAGDMINVGGNKVRPAVVEATIRTVPGVDDVRVFGQRSSIAGQLVACEIVVAKEAAPEQIKSNVQAACRAALQPYECPRLIQIVPEIQVSEAGKTRRS